MLRIGQMELDMPVMQAALAGYSDLAMRRVARRCGAPYAMNEVLLDKIVLINGKKQKRILNIADDDRPLGGQLMGCGPEEFALAANAMVEAGYDAVDINFACPVKKVLGRCRGGYMMTQPDLAMEIIHSVYDTVDRRKPVTLKLRRGMDDTDESEKKFFTILDGAFKIGVDAVTVHPRTVKQKYIGPSRWEFLRKVKKHVGDRIVLGSGDLFSAGDVVRMMEQTGVDGVTLARGCIGNPWLFRECREVLAGRPLPPPPSVAEQREIIALHYQYAIELYGETIGSKIMRKFGIKYAELHPMAEQVVQAFIAVKRKTDWQAVLDRWYDPAVAWPPPRRKSGPGHLVAAGAE